MRVSVITPPAPIVTPELAISALRGIGTDEADLLETYIAAVTEHLDGPEGWLGRALGLQILEARFDNFDCPAALDLPCPPIVSIESVTYRSMTRETVTVDPAAYELIDRTVEPIGSPPWRGGLPQREAITVRYQAGYAVIPQRIKSAILLMVGDLYRFRETVEPGTTLLEVPMSVPVINLLPPRIWS